MYDALVPLRVAMQALIEDKFVHDTSVNVACVALRFPTEAFVLDV